MQMLECINSVAETPGSDYTGFSPLPPVFSVIEKWFVVEVS